MKLVLASLMKKLIFLTITILVIQSLNLNAQTGSIKGVILDPSNNETLVGAAVLIQGTHIGVTTNFDGEFELQNLEPGSYNLQISFISYETTIVENVKVDAGRASTLNIPLREATQQLQGVSVVARRVQHTDVSLINSIRNADLVVSGVSAQQISRSQDRDASQVVRRIPGVTIVDNRFIVVRGLNERYNAVLLNDIYAPSMEDDVRSFSFDIIPSSQLERIMVFKSPSADLPSDFSGGAVKVYTKSIPNHSGFELSYSNSYEPGTTFKDFYGVERYEGHWTGFNRGHYDLPSEVPSDLRSVSHDNVRATIGQAFKNNWVEEKSTAMLNQGVSLSGFFNQPLGSMTLGHMTSVNYSNSSTFEEVDRHDYDAYNRVENKSLPIYWYNDHRYSQNIRFGLIHNYGLIINPNHSIDFKNLFNQNAKYEYVNRGGNHYDFNYFPSNHGFQQVYRTIYTGQFNGQHTFFDKLTEVQWIAGYGFTNRQMPDYKRYRSDLQEVNGDRSDAIIYVPNGAAQPFFLGRFYSEMEENSKSLSVNLTQKIRINSLPQFKPVLKAGAYLEEKDREFLARNIGFAHEHLFDQQLRSLPIDQFFQPENIKPGHLKVDEQSNPNDSYQATSSLKAYYLSASIPFTTKLTLVSGVRIEDYTQTMVSATTSGPVNEIYQSTDLFPSFNLSYSINDKSLVRAAYGKTINRPEFRERAPFSFYDFNYNFNKKGNVFLQDALIDNFDLRWEFYPSASEMVNIGGFYKKFENPIETMFEPGAGSGGAKNFSLNNAESAYSYGIEVDARKSLSGIIDAKILDNFSVLLNAALIRSEITIGAGAGHGRDTDNRPLQGQSPYILNTGIYYSNDANGWQANILYNVVGERIFSTGFWTSDRQILEYPDVWEMPRNIIDLSVTKTFSNNFNVRLGVSDILNQKVILLQDANQDDELNSNNDQILQSYRPGSLITFTIGYKL